MWIHVESDAHDRGGFVGRCLLAVRGITAMEFATAGAEVVGAPTFLLLALTARARFGPARSMAFATSMAFASRAPAGGSFASPAQLDDVAHLRRLLHALQ